MGWFDTPEDRNKKDNEIYAEAVRDGQNESILGGMFHDIAETVGGIIPVPECEDYRREHAIRESGLQYGREHPSRSRDDSSDDDSSSTYEDTSASTYYDDNDSYTPSPATKKSEGNPAAGLVALLLMVPIVIGLSYKLKNEGEKRESQTPVQQSVEPESYAVAPTYHAPVKAPTPQVAWDKITIYEYSDGSVMQVRENSTGIYMTSRTNNPIKLESELRWLDQQAVAREQAINAQRQINRR